MIAIISNINGIFKYNAIPDITPPKNNEPVSPINTLAGYILNIKNANTAPITIAPNTTISFTPSIVAIIVKHVIIIVHTLGDKPSIPSVKFIALVAPNNTNIANGIYAYIGIVIYCFNIGIYVSVPKFKPFCKYNTNTTDINNNPNIFRLGFKPFVFFNINFSYAHNGIIFFNKGFSISILFLIIISPIILYLYVRQIKLFKQRMIYSFKTNIYIGNKILNLNGYLDSGNTLTYKNTLVIITNIDNNFKNKKVYIPYIVIGGSGILECIKVKKVEVIGLGVFENVYIGFSKNFKLADADVLLNGLMKGR